MVVLQPRAAAAEHVGAAAATAAEVVEEARLGSLRLGGPSLLSTALKAQQARPVSGKGL